MLGGNIRKSFLKRHIIKRVLDLSSLKMEIIFQLLLGSGREKSEPFVQNRMTSFSISHLAALSFLRMEKLLAIICDSSSNMGYP